MQETAQKENFFWVDLIRAIVMLGVVVIHVSADVITEWGVCPKSWWWAANFYDSFVRGCVPVFVMLSGALLLPKQESYSVFFRKRFQRIAVPLAFWTLLYLLWQKYFYEPHLSLTAALGRIADGHVYFHLWFLYILIGLYLLTPTFRILISNARQKDLVYFLALWFLVSSLAPFLSQGLKIFTGKTFTLNFSLEPATGFIGYFILGYFLRKYSTEKWRTPAEGISLLSLICCMAGTDYLSSHANTFQDLLYGNMAPNVVFYTASFFVLMITLSSALEKKCPAFLRKGILSCSQASFGIYLIHPMILDTLISGRLGFVLKPLAPHPAYTIPLIVTLVYVLSWLAITFLRKIPYLEKTV